MTTRAGANQLLLDTNVVLWLLVGDRAKVSSRALTALTDEDNELLVSAVSVWEIAIKRSLGKLRISDGWSNVLRQLDFRPLPVTADHATRVEHLPWHHRDPFDRMLIAQAQAEGFTFVTADARIADYDVPVLW